MTSARWIERVRNMRMLEIAAALGLKTQAARGASGGAILGCPACAATTRHPSKRDRRGAVGIRRDGRGWHCHECEQSGDGLDLIAWKMFGRRCPSLTESELGELQTWIRERLHAGSAPSTGERTREESPPPPCYPAASEVVAVWQRCARVDEDAHVGSYLESRAIDPVRVADLDLARALPSNGDTPAWASKWDIDERRAVSWRESGHVLIVPLFDQHGVMRSCLARCVRKASLKSLAPAAFERRGLLMADGLARQVLATGERPEWWPNTQELRLVVAEGEPDHLTIATSWADSDEFAPACLGLVAGSWAPEFALRIPNSPRVVVVIATHSDKSGDKYAETVAQSFAGRAVRLERKHWLESEAAA